MATSPAKALLHGTFLAILVLATGRSTDAWPQEASQPVGMSAATRAALVASMPKGASFSSNNQAYRMVGGLRAIPRTSEPSLQRRLATLRATESDVVEEKAGHVIYRANTPIPISGVNAVWSATPTPSFPVVENVRTGRLGIATNVLVARLEYAAEAAAIGAAQGLKVVFVADNIGFAFYSVPSGRDLLETSSALARDPRVLSVDVEIREHVAVPM